MQFKHPELLWALLLLLIPIIIHLFQLRRFQKEAFTNVKLLKNIKLQTRKSSQLKKWLTLLTRLLLLACAILAFAQPFTTNSEKFKSNNETVVYLDNSFSMQAKGNNGSLLNEAIQDILLNYNEDEEITLFTNDDVFRNTTIKAISNELIGLKHSSNQLSYNSAFLKGQQLFSKDNNSSKNLVLVSDFQQKDKPIDFPKDSVTDLNLVQLKATYVNNISIDSAYISQYNSETIELSVKISNSGEPTTNVPLSLFNNTELIAKNSVDINDKATTLFTIPANKEFNGELSIDDASLQYDNSFYFNISKSDKINVLSINEASDNFLERLYTEDEFIYSSEDYKVLDFSKIEDQDIIILNELESISTPLITALKTFKENGGSVVIIASQNADIRSYNSLLVSLKLPSITEQVNEEKRITTINYDHPLIRNAFYNRVTNFQYPKVNSYLRLSSNSNTVYSYEDASPFLVGLDNSYLFTSAFNDENSNFKKSPLIVPALYNMAKQSLAIPKLYYNISENNTIDLDVQLGQDEILSLEQNGNSVIPLQQTYSKKVSLITSDYPDEAGILEVKNKNITLKKLSFNYPRNESALSYYNLSNNGNYSIESSLSKTINQIKSDATINALWKWFTIFALAFLMIELLILKYFK